MGALRQRVTGGCTPRKAYPLNSSRMVSMFYQAGDQGGAWFVRSKEAQVTLMANRFCW
jgi:putative N-acetylmannosamine-6-phosphate epimerase